MCVCELQSLLVLGSNLSLKKTHVKHKSGHSEMTLAVESSAFEPKHTQFPNWDLIQALRKGSLCDILAGFPVHTPASSLELSAMLRSQWTGTGMVSDGTAALGTQGS